MTSIRKSIIIISLVLVSFTSCLTNGSGKRQNQVRHDEPELTSAQILNLIDELAGWPIDPDLPAHILGASDLVLESTNPRELADLITIGLPIAKTKAQSKPRALFYLGRAGYAIDYKKSLEWVKESASNGSAAAAAFMGFVMYEQGEYEQSVIWLQKAIDGEFKDPLVPLLINSIESNSAGGNKWFKDFNRPDIISALYNQDFESLKKINTLASYYIGAVQNTLWDSEILFLVQDLNFLLELDPNISAKLGLVSKKAQDFGVIGAGKIGDALSDALGIKNQNIRDIALIADQATQDGRRLAMLFETDPKTFRLIYRSMSEFCTTALK